MGLPSISTVVREQPGSMKMPAGPYLAQQFPLRTTRTMMVVLVRNGITVRYDMYVAVADHHRGPCHGFTNRSPQEYDSAMISMSMTTMAVMMRAPFTCVRTRGSRSLLRRCRTQVVAQSSPMPSSPALNSCTSSMVSRKMFNRPTLAYCGWPLGAKNA